MNNLLKKFAICENNLDPDGKSLIFYNLIDEICVYNIASLAMAYDSIARYSKNGLYAIGYISYDIIHNISSDKPLLHFIICQNLSQCKPNQLVNKLIELNLINNKPQPINIEAIESEITKQQFKQMFNQVCQHLKQGNSYQINLTQRFLLDYDADNFALYYQLSRHNPVRYAIFCQFDSVDIMSISPELFFAKHGNKLISRPMKGTSSKGITLSETTLNKANLAHDKKNLAENLIIVDLLRNDLAKIATTGSVETTKLFVIEEYNTLLQMVSQIECNIANNIGLKEIITGLFPCGSISGAPKKKTLEIIQQIEHSPRGIYTGAIGYILPNNDMLFNVAIRTITKYANHIATFGAGGGITIQSNVDNEFNEIYTKIKFINKFYTPNFALVESMLILNNQVQNLDDHLLRLSNSAEKLLFKCNIANIGQEITHYIHDNKLVATKVYKLRLELDYWHKLTIAHNEISLTTTLKRIALLSLPLNTQHFLFKHKTTSPIVRGLYEQLYNEYLPPNLDELIFINQDRQITESRFFNIIIKINNQLLTPPIKCGVLPGIFRQNMLKNNQVIEAILTQEMLGKAEEIYLCNDVRGLIKCSYYGTIET